MTSVELPAARHHNHWHALDAYHRVQQRGQVRYILAAIAVHLALAALFLINLARPDPTPRDDVAIEMVAPPAPPHVEPPPPKPLEAKELPKPHLVPHAVAKPLPRLIETPSLPTAIPPMPAVQREPPPPPPAPAQAAPPPTFVSALYAHLEARKQYPRSAEKAHIGGVALLRFKMNHQGRVLSYSLERSAGSEQLDSEVLALIQRAQPLPIPPAEMPDPLELTIPIQFKPK